MGDKKTAASSSTWRGVGFAGICLFIVFAAVLARSADAASFRVIYNFGPIPDGAGPGNGLIADSLGRLYGTTSMGGSRNAGTVYRLTPPTAGSTIWSEEVLRDFNGKDGSDPLDVLLLGASGEIYGTTVLGGRYGGGTAFRLDDTGAGWTPTNLRNFGAPTAEGAPPDGATPYGGLTLGADGFLYGNTATVVGLSYYGTVFKLATSGHGAGYRTIHRFDAPTDGSLPAESLLPVGSDFLGTTIHGSPGGTVFRMRLNRAGHWKEDIVHQFGVSGDFDYPVGPIVGGRGGVLYGCATGGLFGQGGVFSLAKSGPAGQYAETVIYSFGIVPNEPQAVGSCGIAINPAGQIVGSTDAGGTYGYGTVFELDPPTAGAPAWTMTVLHSFDAKSGNGIRPQGAPLRQGGVYYGVTASAATSSPPGSGIVYQITP